MPSYTITNTAGATVATIGVATTTGAAFPIELIGQGISLYGPIIAASQYRLLENFANSVSPANPVQGMFWFDTVRMIPNYYDGVQFIPLSGLTTNSAALFDMLPTAVNIDLTTGATIPLFTDPNFGDQFHPTGILLNVVGTPGATGPALLNLLVSASEDVLENVSVSLQVVNQFSYFIIQGTTKSVTGGATLQLEIISPATGGALNVDSYVFGFKT